METTEYVKLHTDYMYFKLLNYIQHVLVIIFNLMLILKVSGLMPTITTLHFFHKPTGVLQVPYGLVKSVL